MQLESALRTSSLGIQSHGKAIAVVGDNVSNVSTYGYKKSRAEFSDIVAEGGGAPPTANPGDGVRISSVRQIFTGGIVEDTGRNLDLAIQGNGFFAVGSGENPSYTRAGNFSLDKNGNLVDAAGKSVLGYAPGVAVGTVPLTPISTQVLDLGAKASTESQLSGVLDAQLPVTTLPNNPKTMADVTKQASFTYAMSAFDAQGAAHDVTVAFFKTGPGTWTVQGYVRGSEVGGTADSVQQVGTNVVMQFGEDGKLPAGTNATMALNIPYGGGVAPGNISLDLSGFIQVAAPSAISAVKDNGQAASQVAGLEIGAGGSVDALFQSGQRRSLGTVALADFVNKDGLIREGGYDYKPGETAGAATVGAPDQGAFGSLRSGALERSTVDISEEFIDLVVFQRGYQANSQTFSTTSGLLQQTIQLLK